MVPPRVSSLILYILNLVLELTHRILPNFRDHLCHQPPSGRFRVYQVTQLRTSGVHCRESAGTGLVLNSARRSSSSGWCLFKCRHEPIFMCLSFPTPTIHLVLLSIPQSGGRMSKRFQRKIRARLDLLSIPQSRKKYQTFFILSVSIVFIVLVVQGTEQEICVRTVDTAQNSGIRTHYRRLLFIR